MMMITASDDLRLVFLCLMCFNVSVCFVLFTPQIIGFAGCVLKITFL